VWIGFTWLEIRRNKALYSAREIASETQELLACEEEFLHTDTYFGSLVVWLVAWVVALLFVRGLVS
jgi:hypothetical protein